PANPRPEGEFVDEEVGAHAAPLAEVAEILEETVGDVDGGAGVAAQDLAQLHPWFGGELGADVGIEPRGPSRGQLSEAERGVAEGAGDEEPVPGPRAGAAEDVLGSSL